MEKELLILHGEIKTPPMSSEARIEAGYLIRQLQQGVKLSMPQSRPMPQIAAGCHELRINDADKTWRIVYFVDDDAIVVLEVFNKTTSETPQPIKNSCRRRLTKYQEVV